MLIQGLEEDGAKDDGACKKSSTLGKEAKSRDRWVRWKRSLRLLYLRLMRLKGQPEEVAGGMAIGVFVGMTPTVPLHTVLAVAIAFLLKKSKLAAAVGVWIANPLILPLIYLLDYKLGRVITGKNLPSLVVSDFSLSHLIECGLGNFLPYVHRWVGHRIDFCHSFLFRYQARGHPLQGKKTKAVRQS